MDEHESCKMTEDELWEQIIRMEKALRQIIAHVENWQGDLADNVTRVANEAIETL